MEAPRLAELRVAGQLHDIGKLAIPDRVLNKPGPLDDDEMRLIQMHPVIGAELVRAWGHPIAAQFVLEHHEWIDGTGYPAGLAADAIALEARILHAVDALTAMTSERPYRAAMSTDEALDELRAGSGTQFEDAVVAAVEQLHSRGVAGLADRHAVQGPRRPT